VLGRTLIRPESAKAARYRRRYRGRYVDPSCLDQASQQQLARVQRAVRDILYSRVFLDGAIDNLASWTALAEQEWDIACVLRDACMLRAAGSRLIRLEPAAAHPAIQEILLQHTTALSLVGLAVDQRIEELEAWAAAVLAADREYSACLLGPAAAALNDRFLDLLARAPAHGRTGQIARLSADARAAAASYRELITDPATASPLALPDAPRPGTAT
jgi:hypothetical protein